jgi:hypothetical protein
VRNSRADEKALLGYPIAVTSRDNARSTCGSSSTMKTVKSASHIKLPTVDLGLAK